jgi:hypothetical protein
MCTCIVKTIYNSGQPASYKLNFQAEHLWMDLHLKELPGDLVTIIVRLREDLIFKHPYKVIFNTKTIPDKIKQTKEFLKFKEELLKLLGKSENPNQQVWLEVLKLHVEKGKCPDLSGCDDEATLVRISNYFQSILNTTVTRVQVIELCKALISN